MAGTRLKLQQGVRCLTIEAGWTRTPTDGFMRGGTMAAARIKHLGMPRETAELGLKLNGEVPYWSVFRDEKPVREFTLDDLGSHFRRFAG